jgi:mannose/fructose/N-acetylgalactosamine-specific phosphotransferase system component IIB
MRFQKGTYSACRTIFLFRLPRDVLTALHLGLSIERLNLGGLHAMGKTKLLCKGVNAAEEDLQDLKKILDSGVQVEVRSVPSEPSLDLNNLIKKFIP